MRKTLVCAVSLCCIYASVAIAETLPDPTRAGLALRAVPVEVLAPAIQGAPDALEALETYNLAGNVPTQNGFTRPLVNARQVRLSAADLLRPTPFPSAGGVVTRSEGGDLVWSGEVQVAEAHALRLHLGSVSLPAGTRAWVYAPGGEAAAVPLALFHGRSDLWTGPVRGESLWLEVAVPAAALSPGREARFTLDRILELVLLDRQGRPVTGPGILEKDNHCFVTVPCAEKDFPNTVAGIKEAVARIFFVKDGGGFICSGGLLEDTEPNTLRPLFLTANHCIPDAQVASTVVALFRLWNASCGSAAENGPDRVDGATLLATYQPADGSLLELAGLPPKPRFLPWDADPAAGANGVVVNDVSLPGGFLQVFSRHRIQSECINDENFFSTETLFGGIGGGSSGSLAVNNQGRVIGTLRGICGRSQPLNLCDNPDDSYAFFGRLSTLFNQGFAPFLEPPDAGFFQSTAFPDFAFRVEIIFGGNSRFGKQEAVCLPNTECVSGALPGQAEVFLRIAGPKPNGKLWPTIVKFTTSRVEVTVRQLSTGIERHYVLEGAAPGVDELPGLFDRGGFDP